MEEIFRLREILLQKIKAEFINDFAERREYSIKELTLKDLFDISIELAEKATIVQGVEGFVFNQTEITALLIDERPLLTLYEDWEKYEMDNELDTFENLYNSMEITVERVASQYEKCILPRLKR